MSNMQLQLEMKSLKLQAGFKTPVKLNELQSGQVTPYLKCSAVQCSAVNAGVNDWCRNRSGVESVSNRWWVDGELGTLGRCDSSAMDLRHKHSSQLKLTDTQRHTHSSLKEVVLYTEASSLVHAYYHRSLH